MRPPWTHQVEDAARIVAQPYLLIGNDPGTGKSRTVVMAAEDLFQRGEIGALIVVCPAPVRSVWSDPDPVLGEYAQWATQPYHLIDYARYGVPRQPTPGVLPVIVTNPEYIRRPNRLDPLIAYARTQPTLLVLDESWLYQNPQAAQTKAVFHLRCACVRVVALNGTPGEMKHLFAQYQILSPSILAVKNWYHFRAKFCNTPDAPIWMADQTFKPIGDVQEGDRVMGWVRERGARRLVPTTVVGTGYRRADNVVIAHLRSGRSVHCTADHQWLRGAKNHRNTSEDSWSQVLFGPRRFGTLSRVIDVPRTLTGTQRDAAFWLAGLYDGEGHAHEIAQSRSHNPVLCEHIEQAFRDLGLDAAYRGDRYSIRGGLQTHVNLLNWLPIVRRESLLRKIVATPAIRMERHHDKVVEVEPMSTHDVVSLQTVTGNYFAWGYASKNCITGGYLGKNVVGYQRVEEFQRRTAPFTVLRQARECLDLGDEPVRTQIEAPLSPATWQHYLALQAEMITWLDQHRTASASTAAVKALRLTQLVNGFLGGVEQTDDLFAPAGAGLVEIGREKLDTLAEFLKDYWDQQKVVVFTRYRRDVERTTEELARRYPGVRWFKVYGSQTTREEREERQAALKHLAPGGIADPAGVVANTRSGGAGLNFSQASLCVYLGNDYSLKTRVQSEKRLDRPGQRHRVRFVDVVAVGPKGQRTIDHVILGALRRQEDMTAWTPARWRDVLTTLSEEHSHGKVV